MDEITIRAGKATVMGNTIFTEHICILMTCRLHQAARVNVRFNGTDIEYPHDIPYLIQRTSSKSHLHYHVSL